MSPPQQTSGARSLALTNTIATLCSVLLLLRSLSLSCSLASTFFQIFFSRLDPTSFGFSYTYTTLAEGVCVCGSSSVAPALALFFLRFAHTHGRARAQGKHLNSSTPNGKSWWVNFQKLLQVIAIALKSGDASGDGSGGHRQLVAFRFQKILPPFFSFFL